MEASSKVKIDLLLKDLKPEELKCFIEILVTVKEIDLSQEATEFLPKITKIIGNTLDQVKC